MNRTITESKHVINLIDKMKGQFAQSKQKPSRLQTDPDLKQEKKEEERGSFKQDKARFKKQTDKPVTFNL